MSALTYRRNRRIENENHLFKTKTEIYNTLTRKAYELVHFYEDAYLEVKFAINVGNPKQIDFDKYSDEIDIKGYNFEKEAALHSLLLPIKVLDSIDEFVDAVIYGESPEELTLDTMRKTLLIVYEKVEVLINDFRKDLNVEVLNESLFRRIK